MQNRLGCETRELCPTSHSADRKHITNNLFDIDLINYGPAYDLLGYLSGFSRGGDCICIAILKQCFVWHGKMLPTFHMEGIFSMARSMLS